MTVAPEIINFRFTLVPAIKPEQLHENMRSALARALPVVSICKPHEHVLSVAGGGPSLADTYRELTGQVAAINGSLAWLLDHDVVPALCGVCDPSPHMVDIVEADKRVTYFLASSVHPSVYDKLIKAGCYVVRWNSSSIPGGERILAELEPNSLTIGGGSTMGLRWLTLGYTCGFRTFNLHGYDSSFRIDPSRGKASHAYIDHQDEKEWITFDGYQTRPNFIGQVSDFIGWLERLKEEDVDPIRIEVFGDGLLQAKWRMWKGLNPGWHEGAPKPEHKALTDGFVWPAGDRIGKASALADIVHLDAFVEQVSRRGTVVQAGGNVGVYPAYLARRFHNVHTFEPDPGNYRCLSENIQTIGGNIRAYNAALGERDGTCGLQVGQPENCGALRVTPEGAIPMMRIDDLNLPECDLIWLDIEGYEARALEGAAETIEKFWPAVIIEENQLPAVHGIGVRDAREWLHDRGYVFAVRYGRDALFLPTAVAPLR